MKSIRSMRWAILFLVLLAVLVWIPSFNSTPLQNEGYKTVFGVSLWDMRNSHTLKLKQDMLDATEQDESVNIIFMDAARNPQKQLDDIANILETGVDTLIIQPTDDDRVYKKMQDVKDSGIPVIAISNADKLPECTVQICLDDRWLGYMAGKYIVKLAAGEPLTLLEVQGDMDDDSALNRRDGFRSAIERSNNPNIKIGAVVGGYWMGDEAEANLLGSGLLGNSQTIQAVYAHNDEMAIAVSRVLRQKGIDVPIIGIGGLWADGLRAVKSGEISATIYYPSGGQAAYGAAKSLLEGVARPDKMYMGAIYIDESNLGIVPEDSENTLKIENGMLY